MSQMTRLNLDGGIQIGNPSYNPQTHEACVDIHIWVKATQHSPLGTITLLDIDHRIRPCVRLGVCANVLNIGVGHVELCFNPPNQVCAKLIVGYGGLSLSKEACLNLPIAAALQASGQPVVTNTRGETLPVWIMNSLEFPVPIRQSREQPPTS